MKFLLSLAVFASAGVASAQFITYGSYSQTSDSPLASLAGFQVENFEDGLVNTPGSPWLVGQFWRGRALPSPIP